jgi:cytochrome b561
MQAKRYHPVLAALHRLLAFLLIALLAGGTLSLKAVSNASRKLNLLRIHMLMGGSI